MNFSKFNKKCSLFTIQFPKLEKVRPKELFKKIELQVLDKIFLKNEHRQEYLDCKRKLNDIFGENIKIRSKCKQYEEVEKKSIFLFNIEANCAIQSKVRLLEIEGKEIKQ